MSDTIEQMDYLDAHVLITLMNRETLEGRVTAEDDHGVMVSGKAGDYYVPFFAILYLEIR